MGGFKKQTTKPLSNKGNFENSGRGETNKQSKNEKSRVFSVVLSDEVIDRIKRFQNREDAKRIETQAYIVTEAINAWLDSKGFEK